jgi:D-xylose transport system permease protein
MVWMQWRERGSRAALVFPNAADLAFARVLTTGQIILLFVLVCNQFRGIPLPPSFLAVTALVVWALSQHTPLGRYFYAPDGNEDGRAYFRCPVGKSCERFCHYGIITALGVRFLPTAYAVRIDNHNAVNFWGLEAIAACVIGARVEGGGNALRRRDLARSSWLTHDGNDPLMPFNSPKPTIHRARAWCWRCCVVRMHDSRQAVREHFCR